MGIPLLALSVSFTVLYVALVALSFDRPLWFDELLTYFIACAHDYSQARVWDLNPPLLHLLARFSLWLGSGNPVFTRLPSAVAFYLASGCLFLFCARRVGLAFGLLPVLFLWYSPNLQYATEARPYALLCFFFSALLLLWDLAVTRARRPVLLVAITFCSRPTCSRRSRFCRLPPPNSPAGARHAGRIFRYGWRCLLPPCCRSSTCR